MKVSSRLQEKLKGVPRDGMLDLVLELRGPEPEAIGSRTERIAAAKQAFAQNVEQVEAAIMRSGGVVLDRLWLSGALRARVPAHAIPELSKLDRVVLLDSARPLTAETSSNHHR